MAQYNDEDENMMAERDNPHTEDRPYCRVDYWKDYAACGRDDDWTYARVASAGPRPSYMKFERAASDAMASTLRMMELAFEAGRKAKAAEIRAVLGVAP